VRGPLCRIVTKLDAHRPGDRRRATAVAQVQNVRLEAVEQRILPGVSKALVALPVARAQNELQKIPAQVAQRSQ